MLDNGFEIEKITYFNFFLFPPFMIVRLIHKIFNLEKYILRKINLPFGSSVLAFCKLKGNAENEKS